MTPNIRHLQARFNRLALTDTDLLPHYDGIEREIMQMLALREWQAACLATNRGTP